MSPLSANPPEATRRWRRVALACVIGVALAAGIALLPDRETPPSAPAPERTAAELVTRDGELWDPAVNQRYTGWLVERFPAGPLRSRSWIEAGVLHGLSEGWHTNGVLQIQEHFVRGLSEGPVQRWREDGSPLSLGAARAGVLEGPFRRWHSNGILAESVTLHAGQPDGRALSWFPSGHLQAEVQLSQGQVLTQRFWKDGEQDGRELAASLSGAP